MKRDAAGARKMEDWTSCGDDMANMGVLGSRMCSICCSDSNVVM